MGPAAAAAGGQSESFSADRKRKMRIDRCRCLAASVWGKTKMSTQWGLTLFSVSKRFKFGNTVPIFVRKSHRRWLRHSEGCDPGLGRANHQDPKKRSSNPPLQKTRSCETWTSVPFCQDYLSEEAGKETLERLLLTHVEAASASVQM